MKRKGSKISIILIVLLVIAVIVFFIISLGSIYPRANSKIHEAFKDTKEDARRRHKKLVDLIQKQEALKIELDRKFRRIYFFVRLGLVLIWFAMLFLFYLAGFVDDLGDALNYSEASILLIIILNFLTFGTISNLENYIKIVKTRTENMIYGKYLNIDVKIEMNRKEEKALTTQMEPHQSKQYK